MVDLIVGGDVWMVVVFYLSVVISAVILASLLRRVVWAARLDARFSVLRLKGEWYYRLLGRSPDIPWHSIPQADVLVEHPEEGSRLYVGVISGIEPSKDGGIEELSLRAAQRYRRRDADGKRALVDIPGDIFYVRGGIIHSVNMRYFVVPAPEGFFPWLWWRVSNFVLALWKG